MDEVEQAVVGRASWSVDGGWWMVSGIEMNRIVVIKSSPAVDPGFKFGKKPGQGVRVDWVTGNQACVAYLLLSAETRFARARKKRCVANANLNLPTAWNDLVLTGLSRFRVQWARSMLMTWTRLAR